MRRYLIILTFVGCAIRMPAQLASQWQQIYGGTGVEVAYGVRSCLDQGYIVGGTSSSAGPTDGYIFRVDSFGLVMWSKFYGGPNIDVIRAVEILPDSGFIMAGYTNSYGAGGYDGWLLRLDKNGDTLWTRTSGTNDWDFFYDVECARDGGFICVGGTYGLGQGDEDFYLVRFDANGDTLWTRTYGGSRTDEGRGVIETEDTLLAICGFTESFADSLGDSWLLRLTQSGDTLWTRTLGDLNVEDHAQALSYDTLLDIIIYAGYSMATGNGDGYWEGIYYNNSYWLRSNSIGASFEENTAVRVVHRGFTTIIFTNGTTFTFGGGLGDMLFFTSVGWSFRTYGTTSEDHGYDVDVSHDGGYILCGSTEGYNSITPNAYLVKLDTSINTSATVNIHETMSGNHGTHVFCYPVPANDNIHFVIKMDVVQGEDIAIDITDVAGRLVGTIPKSGVTYEDESTASSVFETSGLAPGLYFYTVRNSSGIIASDRIIISR